MTRTYYGDPIPRSKGPHPDPLADAPTAEDWENACHEVVWKSDPALFARIQEQAEKEREERLARALYLDPDHLREDRDERRRMEREHPYAE